MKSTEQVFTDIYRTNHWRGKDSVSGEGSDLVQTRVIIQELPSLFRELGISTLLDMPCGDFHWMRHVDLTGISYSGADIVQDLIDANNEKYGTNSITFKKMDLIRDELPMVDLIFCRDCLVHLSYEDIFRALNNLCKSKALFLLTTTFTRSLDNLDIATGQWRVLNLERAPFRLPIPLKIIWEDCTEFDGIYADKSLGLWKISDIRDCLSTSHAISQDN